MLRLFVRVFYPNWGEKNCSLYQGLRYIEVLQYISDQFMSENV